MSIGYPSEAEINFGISPIVNLYYSINTMPKSAWIFGELFKYFWLKTIGGSEPLKLNNLVFHGNGSFVKALGSCLSSFA